MGRSRPRLFRLPMPEGGAERDVFWLVNHNCPNGRALKGVVDDENLDLVCFPVGLVGEGMPANIPFEVTTTTPCEACGKFLRAWFEWAGPRIFLPS